MTERGIVVTIAAVLLIFVVAAGLEMRRLAERPEPVAEVFIPVPAAPESPGGGDAGDAGSASAGAGSAGPGSSGDGGAAGASGCR
jgi:hypothetical protein